MAASRGGRWVPGTYGWNLDAKRPAGDGAFYLVAGVLTLAGYGVVVNAVPWNFSRLMCAYIAAFTLLSFSWRRFVLGQDVPRMAWLGVAVVVIGGLVVVFGEAF